jgi:PAS domain-containing protein
MKEVKDIRLIVIDEKPESAESISRVLRDSGQLVPVQWANSPLRLENLISQSPTPIILANASLPWFPFDQICQMAQQHDYVTIALGITPDTTLELRVLRQGAVCLANPENPSLFEQQLQQAFKLCYLKREIAEKTAQIEALDGRCDALLDTAAEPIAYTSEGVITDANAAFAKVVGADNSADLSGRLISDFIAPESLYDFSRQLRRLMRDESSHIQMDDAAIATLQGSSSPAIVFMHNVEIDGEHSTQILIRDCAQADRSAVRAEPASSSREQTFTQPLRSKIKAAPDALPSLSIVHDQSDYEPDTPLQLKAALDKNNINGMMARLNAWETQHDALAERVIGDSANDAYAIASLPELLVKEEASIELQPMLALHANNSMQLARIKAGDRLMPISQTLTESLDSISAHWLLAKLNEHTDNDQLIIAPVSKDIISANSIEFLQQIKANKNLLLGLSENSLSSDFHGSNQFLLQLQKLGLKASLWSQSPASVLADCLSDLANSVRSGIHSIVLDHSHNPVMDDSELEADWARLVSLCQKYDIEIIAQRPNDEQDLQTWWRLGIGWCMTENNAQAGKLQQTGTTAK